MDLGNSTGACSEDNITNILRAPFVPIFFQQKKYKAIREEKLRKILMKSARKMLVKLTPEEDEDEMVQDLKDGDEAAPHRQSQDATHVSHKPGVNKFLIQNSETFLYVYKDVRN
jgi:hypothetical protein